MPAIDQGDPAPDVTLEDADGQAHSLKTVADAPAVVVGFVTGACETSRAYEDRIADLAGRYEDVPFLLVDPEPGDRDELAGLSGADGVTYLLDPDHEATGAYGVSTVPHFFVLDGDRELLYDGRFDDAWRDPDRVMRPYIEEALGVVFGKRDHLELDRTLPVGTRIG